jgi:outer membrane protein W
MSLILIFIRINAIINIGGLLMIKLQKTSIALITAILIIITSLPALAADVVKPTNKLVIKLRGGYMFSAYKGHLNYGQDLTLNNKFYPNALINKADVKFHNGRIYEIAAGYFLTDNIAIEGSIGHKTIKISTETDSKADTIALYVRAHNKSSKAVDVIPITALIQYHFFPESSFRPYVGAGYSYRFMNGGADNISLKNGGGIVGQIGFDIPYNDLVGFNVDVKYTHRPSSDINVKNVFFMNPQKIPQKYKDVLPSSKTLRLHPSTTAITAGLTFKF